MASQSPATVAASSAATRLPSLWPKVQPSVRHPTQPTSQHPAATAAATTATTTAAAAFEGPGPPKLYGGDPRGHGNAAVCSEGSPAGEKNRAAAAAASIASSVGADVVGSAAAERKERSSARTGLEPDPDGSRTESAAPEPSGLSDGSVRV